MMKRKARDLVCIWCFRFGGSVLGAGIAAIAPDTRAMLATLFKHSSGNSGGARLSEVFSAT